MKIDLYNILENNKAVIEQALEEQTKLAAPWPEQLYEAYADFLLTGATDTIDRLGSTAAAAAYDVTSRDLFEASLALNTILRHLLTAKQEPLPPGDAIMQLDQFLELSETTAIRMACRILDYSPA